MPPENKATQSKALARARAGGADSGFEVGISVLTATVLACVATIFFLVSSVAGDLRYLNSAPTDSTQWALAQLEVDYLVFDSSIAQAIVAPRPDLDRVRLVFDIFYSRVTTLQESYLAGNLPRSSDYMKALGKARSFLDENVPLIDSPDPDLRGALRMLAERADSLHEVVRDISNTGVALFAAESDARRLSLAGTLFKLAAVTSALVTALLLLAYFFNRLNLINVRRGRDLEEANERKRVILATSPDAIVVGDAQGKIIDFNEAAETLFRISRAEAIGKSIGEMIVLPEHAEANDDSVDILSSDCKALIADKGRTRVQAMRSDGTSFPAELGVQATRIEGEKVVVAFIRDISTEIAAEKALMAARDSALSGEKAKADFLMVMSHEIRTPLNGVIGNLALLGQTALTPQQRAYANNMDISGRILMDHVNAVLEVTRHEAGVIELRPAPVDLSALMRDLIDGQTGAGAARGNVLSWTWTGTPLPRVMADEMRLSQILLNILGNALKFTDGGAIHLEATRTSEVPDALGRDWVEFSISDTGIGIPGPDQARIFQDFVTTDTGAGRRAYGAGLGLGIARRLAHAMGGEIGVESEPGKGSRFWVHIPFMPAGTDAAAEVQAAAEAEPSRQCMSILAVEDNDINAQVLRDMLEKGGHRVTLASGGQAGAELARSTRFDLILTDLTMPDMDGFQMTERIREADSASCRTPIIAISANVFGHDPEFLAHHGIDGFLAKPIRWSELQAILAERQPEDPEDQFDRTQNATLRQGAGHGYARLVERFEGEMASIFAALADPGTAADDLAALSHKVAGSAAVFGALSCRDALLAIERAARSQSAPSAAAMLPVLRAAWEEELPLVLAESAAADPAAISP